MTDPVASTAEIRSHFPALARLHGGRSVAYLDAPGGTQVPRVVADAMTEYLLHHNANTHWAYPTSAETDAIIDAAREAAADFLHASRHEIAFGANMTTLTFHLARTLGRTWSRGDEVIVTQLDHQANVAPWRALERDLGIVIRVANIDKETAQLDLEHLASLVSSKTKLVAVGGASNAVGTVNDLEAIRGIAASALMFVDAVHLAPHELVDVQRIGCDFLACSAYKFYGPHVGILYGREALLAELPFPKVPPAPETSPERVETGTQNHEGIAGARAVIDFLASLAGTEGSRRERLERTFAAFHERGLQLLRMAWDALSAMPRVRLYGPPPDARRTPTLAFSVDGITGEAISNALADEALFASHGNFYATTVFEALGIDDLLRVGFACYSTEEEVARLIEAVARLAT